MAAVYDADIGAIGACPEYYDLYLQRYHPGQVGQEVVWVSG
jgi:hypothetical protein